MICFCVIATFLSTVKLVLRHCFCLTYKLTHRSNQLAVYVCVHALIMFPCTVRGLYSWEFRRNSVRHFAGFFANMRKVVALFFFFFFILSFTVMIVGCFEINSCYQFSLHFELLCPCQDCHRWYTVFIVISQQLRMFNCTKLPTIG